MMAKSKHPLYTAWKDMKRRCSNPDDRSYYLYGERGITVCDAWRNDFWKFASDMGPKPTGKHSLDRIDNNGNYEPGNCRWATQSEQNRNSRIARHIEANGESHCITDWASKFGISQSAMSRRIIKMGEVAAIAMGYRRAA